VIDAILPHAVASAEAFGDDPAATLFPEEEVAVARAVERRRRAFATARACGRRALAGLGLPAVAIPREESGAPRWPAGVVGSITHCAGYRAAAVARARDASSVGIDAEPNEPLPSGVLERIAAPAEIARLRELAASHPDVRWDRLAFSAKEAVYKAWFPLARRWLGFEDAELTADPLAGTFSVRLGVPGPVVDGRPLAGFAGRWVARDGLIATAVVVPAVHRPVRQRRAATAASP
jgi:4'-phosphopantetheinyl transferase EntD